MYKYVVFSINMTAPSYRQHNLRQLSAERQQAANILSELKLARVYRTPKVGDMVFILYNNGIFYKGKITQINPGRTQPYRIKFTDESGHVEYLATQLNKKDFPSKWYLETN